MRPTARPSALRPFLTLPLLAVLAACAGAPPAPEAPAAEAAPPPLPPRPQARDLGEEEAALVSEMAGTAATLRQLEWKGPVTALEGGPELVEWLVHRELRELKARGLYQASDAFLRAFELIAPDQQLDTLLFAVIGEQARGLYDEKDGVLMVIPGPTTGDAQTQRMMEDAGLSEQRLFLFHELVHALQDQHWDLAAFRDPALTEDAGNARAAVVEGDATYAMYEYLFQKLAGRHVWELPTLVPLRNQVAAALEQEESRQLREAPAYLRGTLLFSYVDGMLFVDAVFRRGGWEAVNRLFENPPATTEQVLHPEKYFAGEGAAAVELPALRPLEKAGWREVTDGRMGELGLRLFLQTLAERDGEAAAAPVVSGWGGDHYRVLEKADGAPAAVWEIVFDAPEHAETFLEEAKPLLAGRPGWALRRLGPVRVAMASHLPPELSRKALDEVARARE